MFARFKRKPLETRISLAKKYAHDTKFSGKHANLVYMIALHFNWEDAAEHFFTQYVQEK